MYLAEIHGKLSRDNENKEDILTSNVFSFFKYAPRHIFLKSLLKDLGITVSNKEAKAAEFIFWRRFKDNTEPDLVLLAGEYYLLFESKYFSGFGKKTELTESQLIREVEGGMLDAKSMGLKFKLIAITADYSYKESKFTDIPEDFMNDFVWTNWQRVTLLLSDILEGEVPIDHETRLMAEDLYDLLIRKGLRNFQGLGIIKIVKRIKCFEDLFFVAKTALRRGSFIGFIEALSSGDKINKQKESIYLKQGVLLFKDLMPVNGKRIKENKVVFLEKEAFDE